MNDELLNHFPDEADTSQGGTPEVRASAGTVVTLALTAVLLLVAATFLG